MTSIETTTNHNWRPKFTVDAGRILHLLTGDRFYSSKDAALREAILNAIDACHRLRQSNPNLTPDISIHFNDENLNITISDNGDGMSQNEIESLFARIGASMSRVTENSESVGEFGIGVVSYFLISDDFEVQTRREGHSPVGLIFSTKMLDAITPATVIAPTRKETGTTLTLRLRNQELYNLMLEKFPHWCRGVEGLNAIHLPMGATIPQGRTVKPESEVPSDLPDWAEAIHLGPPTGFDRWSILNGQGLVDILYRGVFVQQELINGLWGMEGSLSVHPKRLKPQLNREGFLADDLKAVIIPFLQSIHPKILEAGLSSLATALDDPEAKNWPVEHLVALWLAIPRTPPYQAVVSTWDKFFQSKKLFQHLTQTDIDDISLEEISRLPKPFFLAPDNLNNATDVVGTAVRLLRAQGKTVIRGVTRNTGYLSSASFIASSTSELLQSYFSDQLHSITRVDQIAEDLTGKAARVAEIFPNEPKVALIHLGKAGAPLVSVGGELWVNIDTDAGKAITQDVCTENQGRQSLLVACYTHAEAHIGLVPQFCRGPKSDADHLSLVRRQYLRGITA